MATADSTAPSAKVEGFSGQPRRESVVSENSQTAREYIDAQLKLEADALEALPYSFDSCTRALGPLRQSLFSCLTCSPPPSDPNEPYTPAGVCYSCSISCHGEHTLVELFTKRNFVCDCGTTRLPSTSPCNLRAEEQTGTKGVHSEEPASGNKYNHNFRNRFCGCEDTYDPHEEKGTMFQCLGLGTVETGGCGEDWWHPECLVGLPRDWHKGVGENGNTEKNANDVDSKPTGESEQASDELPLPPGFPAEDDFETFICYKCLNANPWLKRYAGTAGFMPPVYKQRPTKDVQPSEPDTTGEGLDQAVNGSKKRKLDDTEGDEPDAKRAKEEIPTEEAQQCVTEEGGSNEPGKPKHDELPAEAPKGQFSLFVKEDFRDHFCRCPTCFVNNLSSHPQLREEEEVYEPPLSDGGGEAANPTGSQHSGSLLERGEAALSNVDRVRAIEGVMVYNHLKDKVKEFLKPFAETGEAVSADAIKDYFTKLRGDEETAQDGQTASGGSGDGGEGDNRREQSGY